MNATSNSAYVPFPDTSDVESYKAPEHSVLNQKSFTRNKTVLIPVALVVSILLVAISTFVIRATNLLRSTTPQISRSLPNASVQSPQPKATSLASTSKEYINQTYGYSFTYPEKLQLRTEGEKVILTHSIPYKNQGACDMMGDEKTYDMLTDFNVTFEIFDEKQSTPFDYVDGTYEAGILKGEYVWIGAEGCGVEEYYFPLPDGRFLKVTKDLVQALSSVIVEEKRQEVLRVPGVISQEESQQIFREILSTFTLDKGVNGTDNSSYYSNNNLYVMKEIDECAYISNINCVRGKSISVYITLPENTQVGFQNGKYIITLDHNIFEVAYRRTPHTSWDGPIPTNQPEYTEITTKSGIVFSAEKVLNGFSSISESEFLITKSSPQNYLTDEDVEIWGDIIKTISTGEPFNN